MSTARTTVPARRPDASFVPEQIVGRRKRQRRAVDRQGVRQLPSLATVTASMLTLYSELRPYNDDSTASNSTPSLEIAARPATALLFLPALPDGVV